MLQPDHPHPTVARGGSCAAQGEGLVATGEGLLAPFRQIDVDLTAAPRLVGGPAPYRPPAWNLIAAPIPADHFATVALWDRT